MRLVGRLSGGERGYSGHRLRVELRERVEVDSEVSGDDAKRGDDAAQGSDRVWRRAVVTAPVDDDGSFTVDLPDDTDGDATLVVLAPDGEVLARETIPVDQVTRPITLEVAPKSSTMVERDPGRDVPTIVRGRVIAEDGLALGQRQLVLVRAEPAGGDAQGAVVVFEATTDANGYFSGPYPPGRYRAAHASVRPSGADAVPVSLVDDGAFPARLLVVTPIVRAGDVPDGTAAPCGCADPPRSPGRDEFASSSDVYSADLGGGRCVDLTVPNRTLEEFSYFLAVRTTDPVVEKVERRDPLPPAVRRRLATTLEAKRLELDQVAGAAGVVGGEGADGREDAPVVHLERAARIGDVQGALRRSLHDLFAGDTAVTSTTLQAIGAGAPWPLILEKVREDYGRVLGSLVVAGRPPSRAPMSADNPVDWDRTATVYQATDIAHGHLLRFKQAWHADGYSLGDLLYSLPLAPCQKKQIAIVDWDRREVAARAEDRTEEEELANTLSRDRDISDIVSSVLTEQQRGASRAETESSSGGFSFPGFGGTSSASGSSQSVARQDSSRALVAGELQRLGDTTMQAASAVRSQRATVVQTARQGESMRVTTEVVANHNHCHAMTVEYFEVLRHFLVTHELVDVQECLFIPLPIDEFDDAKVLRWQQFLSDHLRAPELRPGFGAIERIWRDYEGSDLPTGSFADEAVELVDGDLRVEITIPRPRDPDATESPDFDDPATLAARLNAYRTYLQTVWGFWERQFGESGDDVYGRYFRGRADRDRVWREELAPRLVERLIEQLEISFELTAGTAVSAGLDASLISEYRPDVALYVRLNNAGIGRAGVTRRQISGVTIRNSLELPDNARLIVRRAFLHYRTAHLSHALFPRASVNDSLLDEGVLLATPPDHAELVNPRQRDREWRRRLLDHLNQHLEYYHKVIWGRMDPDRRYLLLDGFEAPNAHGRSVASVVENRVIGVVGNSLVMPVGPGIHLDPTLRFKDDDGERRAALLDLYPTQAAPPVRISVPTRGVFAEAVMGSCNSCEEIDESRFWRFDDAPCGDEPTSILPVDTASRRAQPPDLTPTALPAPVVNIQNAPAEPNPAGLAAALRAITTPNIFRDLSGLTQNQRNALAALQTSAQETLGIIQANNKFATDLARTLFGGGGGGGGSGGAGGTSSGEAGKLAKRQQATSNVDKTTAAIRRARDRGDVSSDQARSLTNRALQNMVGDDPSSLTQEQPVRDLLNSASTSGRASASVARGDEFVQVDRLGDTADASTATDFVDDGSSGDDAASDVVFAAGGTTAAITPRELTRDLFDWIRAEDVGFTNGNELRAYWVDATGDDFVAWFNSRCARRGAFTGKSIAVTGSQDDNLTQMCDQFSVIFASDAPVNLVQFAALITIMVSEVGGKGLAPRQETFGRGRVDINGQRHQGLAYGFDSFTYEVQRPDGTLRRVNRPSYQRVVGNRPAYDLFRDLNFADAHQNAGGATRFLRANVADVLSGAAQPTPDPVWNGSTWPAGVDTREDPNINGFIMEADFYKFRGRGWIQLTGRGNYLPVIQWIQGYTGADRTVMGARDSWTDANGPLDPHTAATRSTNDEWRALFEQTNGLISAVGVATHRTGRALATLAPLGPSGDGIDDAELEANRTTLNGRGPGSIYAVGAATNADGGYRDRARAGTIQLLATLRAAVLELEASRGTPI